MAFSPEEFAQYQRLIAQAQATLGPDFMSKNPYGLYDANGGLTWGSGLNAPHLNAANPTGSVLRYTPTGPTPDYGTNENGSVRRFLTPDASPLSIDGWDVAKFGNPSEWNANDILPNGMRVSDYEKQIEANKAAYLAQNPGGVSSTADTGNFFMNALKSPGFGGVLLAAGLGTALGGAGAAGPGVTGNFGETLADIAAQDAASGSTAFGSLPAAAGAGAGVTGSFAETLADTAAQDSVAGSRMFQSLGLGPAATTAAQTGAKSALQKLLDGSADAADYLKLAGTIGSTALGAYSDNQKTNALQSEADKNFAIGAPSRLRYEGSFAPGFTMANDPGYTDALNQGSDSLLRRLSATSGNPYGTPGGLIEANKQINASLALPALQNYRNQNAATGGFNAFSTAAPASAQAAIGSQGNLLTNIAGGISDILNPKPAGLTLDDLRRMFQSGNGNTTPLA